MMTCKDCRMRDFCADPQKSFEVDEDGDSHAYWCDDFESNEGQTEAHKDGYVAIQGRYSYNFAIFDESSGKEVMHCQCRKFMSEAELEDAIDLFQKLIRQEC